MTMERVDAECPDIVVMINTDNPREYSIEGECRCGAPKEAAPTEVVPSID